MNLIDKKQAAYEAGKAAALRGDSLTKHRTSYALSADLWTRFQLGYLDAVRDMRRAKHHKGNRHGQVATHEEREK